MKLQTYLVEPYGFFRAHLVYRTKWDQYRPSMQCCLAGSGIPFRSQLRSVCASGVAGLLAPRPTPSFSQQHHHEEPTVENSSLNSIVKAQCSRISVSYVVFVKNRSLQKPSGEGIHAQRVQRLQLDLRSCIRARFSRNMIVGSHPREIIRCCCRCSRKQCSGIPVIPVHLRLRHCKGT